MTPLEAIAHALRDRYRERGYTVDLTIGIIGDPRANWHQVPFFTKEYKHIATIWLTTAGIYVDHQKYAPNARSALYDYNDPALLDQLDQRIKELFGAHFHRGFFHG